MSTVRTETITLKNVIINFPRVFKPTAFQDGDAKKYSVRIMIPKEDIETKKLIETLMTPIDTHVKSAKLKLKQWALKDGDEDDNEYNKGYWYFNAKANEAHKPLLIDRACKVVDESSGFFTSGNIVNANVSFWLCALKTGNFVSANLHGLQYISAGTPFAGAVTASVNDFEVLPEDESAFEDADGETGLPF